MKNLFPAHPLRASALLALASLCTFAAQLAQAQSLGRASFGSENGITLYGGYRAGGNLTETTTGQNVEVGGTGSVSLAVDIAFEPRKQLQAFYSRQKTDLSSGAFPVSTGSIPLAIEYFHIGGTAFFDDLSGGYMVGGIGATVFRPEGAGLTSEIRPSMNLGFGCMLPLGRGLGVRVEARAYATLLNSSGGLFCTSNSGCLVSIKGGALYQAEMLVGLTARF